MSERASAFAPADRVLEGVIVRCELLGNLEIGCAVNFELDRERRLLPRARNCI